MRNNIALSWVLNKGKLKIAQMFILFNANIIFCFISSFFRHEIVNISSKSVHSG